VKRGRARSLRRQCKSPPAFAVTERMHSDNETKRFCCVREELNRRSKFIREMSAENALRGNSYNQEGQ
jgi:hypothetical protein